MLQFSDQSTHQLHSAEASHPQSTDDVEIVQGHTGEEISLRLQPEPGQRTINNQVSFEFTGKCDSSASLGMKVDSSCLSADSLGLDLIAFTLLVFDIIQSSNQLFEGSGWRTARKHRNGFRVQS